MGRLALWFWGWICNAVIAILNCHAWTGDFMDVGVFYPPSHECWCCVLGWWSRGCWNCLPDIFISELSMILRFRNMLHFQPDESCYLPVQDVAWMCSGIILSKRWVCWLGSTVWNFRASSPTHVAVLHYTGQLWIYIWTICVWSCEYRKERQGGLPFAAVDVFDWLCDFASCCSILMSDMTFRMLLRSALKSLHE